MTRALVAIGVSKAPPLDDLDGAVKDANDIADWANACHFEHVRAFTDEDGAAVKAQDIFEHCDRLLKMQDLEHLIIFFSGHGYALPGHEVWLLPQWNTNSNEGVNVTVSLQNARYWERPYISFIADSCRQSWNEPQGITGFVILPRATASNNSRVDSKNSRVDEFFATRFGDVSQEYQPAELRASYGVFSREVLNGLKGAAAVTRDRKYVVTSRSLEDYLTDAVPTACANILGAAIQHPGTNAQWRQPKDVYAEFAGPKTRGGKLAGLPPRRESVASSAAVNEALARQSMKISQDALRYQAAEGRESFAPGAGLTIVGADVQNIVTSSGHARDFLEDGVRQIRLSPDAHRDTIPTTPITVLIQISNSPWAGYWIAVPVYPELIATALIDENGFSSLNYRPSEQFRESGLDSWRLKKEAELSEALANAAAMFRHGVMPSSEQMAKMIEIMRDNKYNNPALAIVAAYICHRLGDFKQIADMERYGIGRGPYTPYDLLLLSGREKPAPGRQVAGAFPLMSPGWGLLPAAEFPFDDRLLHVVGGLVPSLWTMANPQAGAILADLVSTTGVTFAEPA